MSYAISLGLIFGTGIGLVILANFLFYMILGEVNGRSRVEDRISAFGVNTKVMLVLKRHAELFPDSRLRAEATIALFCGITCAVVAFVGGILHYSVR
jgi:hypothetical protein